MKYIYYNQPKYHNQAEYDNKFDSIGKLKPLVEKIYKFLNPEGS